MTQGTYKDLGTYCDWIYENRMKVIGEFVCDKVYEIEYRGNGYYCKNESVFVTNQVAAQSCLDFDDLFEYLGVDRRGYGLHISDLKIYDKPKELSEFIKPCPYDGNCQQCEFYSEYSGECRNCVTRPPQSWCYVEEL